MTDMNWRDKDDLELTSEDLDAMIAEGTPVAVRGPMVPSAARIGSVPCTFGPPNRPETFRPAPSGVRISRPIPA